MAAKINLFMVRGPREPIDQHIDVIGAANGDGVIRSRSWPRGTAAIRQQQIVILNFSGRRPAVA